MMTGTQNGLPIKVPTIPIKVVNPNTTQSSTIPGVLVAAAKPNSGSNSAPTTGSMIRATNTNLILKGKAIPLVLEKSKVQNAISDNTSGGSGGACSTSAAMNSSSKVPNILRGTNSSPSKNTIDRQIVSHEATIELRKNILSKATSPVPKENANINGNNQKQLHAGKNSIDLLQPIFKPEAIETNIDLSEINLRCETNELGAIEVKTMKMESDHEESSDQSGIDLMCKETISLSPPNQQTAAK